MRIPFTKAHGAKNDFLLTWANEAPREGLPDYARAICDRYTGVGADGWILVAPGNHMDGIDGGIELYNSDGSKAGISGNGTRCAAAFLVNEGLAKNEVAIKTGAGVRHLKVLEQRGLAFRFEMNMGNPAYGPEDLSTRIETSAGPIEAALLDVGNPQCAIHVEGFDLDWRTLGAELERHPRFPNRTNVSFYRVVDGHTIEVRFFERGAGETMSSGTGSTGAVAAAVLKGLAKSPVTALTPAGPLDLRWDGDLYLVGPAEITADGEFYGG
jgi:diaminopimelate epimerase